MELPGRLRTTTLGDLLGTLHRAEATGTLQLVEDRGRSHRVHLSRGLIVAVEVDGASPSLAEILRGDGAADEHLLKRSLLRAMASQRLHGEVLVDEFRISAHVVGRALRRQVLARLAVLDGLADARVSFRVAVRPPRWALLGTANERPGATDSGPDARPGSWNTPIQAREFLVGRRRARPRSATPAPPPTGGALRTLGLDAGADAAEIKRAYRRLARTLHPDTHPHATDDERRSLQARFSAVTEAYRSLTA